MSISVFEKFIQICTDLKEAICFLHLEDLMEVKDLSWEKKMPTCLIFKTETTN